MTNFVARDLVSLNERKKNFTFWPIAITFCHCNGINPPKDKCFNFNVNYFKSKTLHMAFIPFHIIHLKFEHFKVRKNIINHYIPIYKYQYFTYLLSLLLYFWWGWVGQFVFKGSMIWRLYLIWLWRSDG